MWGTTAQPQTLLVTLKIRNRPRGGILCIFGSRTFFPIGWMCKKQTSDSHSSTESEVVSKKKHYALPRTSHTRKRFLACGSSGVHASQLGSFCCLSFKQSSPLARFMSHAQCTWLERTPLPPPHSTSSSLCPSHGSIHCDPHPGASLAVLPNKPLLQVMSPTNPSR